jgi:hypothetical protein
VDNLFKACRISVDFDVGFFLMPICLIKPVELSVTSQHTFNRFQTGYPPQFFLSNFLSGNHLGMLYVAFQQLAALHYDDDGI